MSPARIFAAPVIVVAVVVVVVVCQAAVLARPPAVLSLGAPLLPLPHESPPNATWTCLDVWLT